MPDGRCFTIWLAEHLASTIGAGLISLIDKITPLVLTYNEAPNIRRTLGKLLWARRIVVVDSGSTDGTLEILQAYPQVDVVHHTFVDLASQCNFGLALVATPWVLSLDADYELSDQLIRELGCLTPPAAAAGYRARFVYRIHGRPLRGSLYPPRTVLYRQDRAHYRQEGHAHRVALDGEILALGGVVYHDDRKPLSRWVASQQRYARAEAEYLLSTPLAPRRLSDKVRLMVWPAPIAVFLYTLFVKGCLLDGWPGWYYTLQRTVAEMLMALQIIEHRSGRGLAGAHECREDGTNALIHGSAGSGGDGCD